MKSFLKIHIEKRQKHKSQNVNSYEFWVTGYGSLLISSLSEFFKFKKKGKWQQQTSEQGGCKGDSLGGTVRKSTFTQTVLLWG